MREENVQTWFKDWVWTAINNSIQVADAYLLEHKMLVEESILKLSHTIDIALTLEYNLSGTQKK